MQIGRPEDRLQASLGEATRLLEKHRVLDTLIHRQEGSRRDLLENLVGIAVPLVLQRRGRDPVQGASVLLTFITDSMGFLLFLGLVQIFLL